MSAIETYRQPSGKSGLCFNVVHKTLCSVLIQIPKKAAKVSE
jgi:hypothetical protein